MDMCPKELLRFYVWVPSRQCYRPLRNEAEIDGPSLSARVRAGAHKKPQALCRLREQALAAGDLRPESALFRATFCQQFCQQEVPVLCVFPSSLQSR